MDALLRRTIGTHYLGCTIEDADRGHILRTQIQDAQFRTHYWKALLGRTCKDADTGRTIGTHN